MPGEPVVIGPFSGGLANRTDASSIDDLQMTQCVNWIHGIDGTLISRFPIWDTLNDPVGLTERLFLLGYATLFADATPFASGITDILIGSNKDGTFILRNGIWSEISNSNLRDFVTYGNADNKVFFPSALEGLAGSGGWWDESKLSVQTLANMPVGYTIAVHKDRIWIAGDPSEPSRVFYSAVAPVGATADWDQPAAGFIDVNPGDGQYITHLQSYQDMLVIFKNDSTFVLNYDGTISRGQLINISTIIGAFDTKSVTTYRDTLFVYHNGNAYGFDGSSFEQINKETRLLGNQAFAAVYADPIVFSTTGDRLVLRHYENVYIFNFYSGGWMTWDSSVTAMGKFVQQPVSVGSEDAKFFMTSADPLDTNIYAMNGFWDATHTENFNCQITTKTFDFGASYKFKRLFWWACDASTDLAITGSASPIAANFVPNWSDVLAGGTWATYLPFTWGSLFNTLPDVITGPITSQTGTVRRVYKFLKGLRFRQIKFSITMTSDGSSVTGPQRLFSLTPMLAAKETIVKQTS